MSMRELGVVRFFASRTAVVGMICVALASTSGVALAENDGPRAKRAPVELEIDWDALEAIDARQSTPRAAKSEAAIEAEQAGHEIAAARAQNRVSVIVHFDNRPGFDRRPAIRNFARENQGRVKYEYKAALPNAMNLRDIPEGKLQALANLPGVTRVEQDQYHADLVGLHDATPLVRALQSQITGAGLTADGSGARVCVGDTGIDMDHVMYSARIDTAASFDFYNNDSNPDDDHGHGSHVAGIAVGGTGLSVDFGCGAGSQEFQGVAPEATLIGAKILNQFGGGFDSDIIAGIDHCADQSASGGQADVINLSIGTGAFSGPCSHSWAVAANNAVANGVVVVAASGNENNTNAMGSPACGVDVIGVGATYKSDYPTCEDNITNWNWGNCVDSSPNQDQIVCFSNENDFIDVAAPGANIWSASNAAGGGSIVGQSGTSMASPMVAGLAALILSADPTLTPSEVRQIIRDGAIDMGAAGFDRAYGHGRIDVINSLNLVGPGCTTNGDCDDGDVCNGAETCNGGSCQSGTPLNCDDSDACTADSCDAGSGCVNTTISCDDGDSCTVDSCDSGSGCVNTEPPCQNGDGCCPSGCDNSNDSDCPVCDNDGTCEAGEDCNSCPNDCISGSTSGAVCGNGTCEAGNGEDCNNCPSDCNGITNGPPSGRFCCGASEGCGDSRCNSSGFACTETPVSGASYCCGDATCEGDEDSFNCAIDCGAPPACGDGFCDPGEDECNCSADCGAPAGSETSCTDGIDNDCDGATDCNDADCDLDPACDTSCGGNKAPCNSNADCCSNNCKGGSCKGN